MAGCKGDAGVTTPTAPGPPAVNVSGNWSAMLSGLDAAAANGELLVTFDHRHIDADRGLLLGTWSLTSPDRSSTRSGTVSGVVMGTVAQIELAPVPRFQCQSALDALLAGVLSVQVSMAADRLAGTVSAHTCGARFDSTIELRR
ncbi:MAG TPA: hypothetical protein VMO26_28120 [Vicinamibacterales bacterium]|nr:hypothetical protein [Vicinamibacterales bacterium]